MTIDELIERLKALPKDVRRRPLMCAVRPVP